MNIFNSKRLMLVYATIISWLGLGALGALNGASYASLSVYFLALTGFVATYIWGESVRPAESSSILSKGKNSSREILIYVCVLIWIVVGVFGVMKKASLEELAAYYSSLTPFVGSYLIGVSYKPAATEPPTAGAA